MATTILPIFAYTVKTLRPIFYSEPSLKKLAKELGISQAQLKRIEQGKEKVEDPELLERFSTAFNLSPRVIKNMQKDIRLVQSEKERKSLRHSKDVTKAFMDYLRVAMPRRKKNK